MMVEIKGLNVHGSRALTERISIDCLVDRGFSFERNCVLRRWESKTLQ